MGSRISRVTPSLGFTVVMTSSIVVVVCSIAGKYFFEKNILKMFIELALPILKIFCIILLLI